MSIYKISIEETTEEEYQYKNGDTIENRKRIISRTLYTQEVTELDLIAVISSVNHMNVIIQEKGK